jgi:CheY-like chemotaxis protein
MVIDDDEDIREILTEILTDAGYEVLASRNGVEALAALEHARPCLILLDLNMPVMDGVEFRHAQRRHPIAALIPTVVMSAVHSMKERIAGLGIETALQKPLKLKQLMEIVNQYCEPRSGC